MLPMRTPMPIAWDACCSNHGRKSSIRGTITKCNTTHTRPITNHPKANSRKAHLTKAFATKKVRLNKAGESVIGFIWYNNKNYDPQQHRFLVRSITICATHSQTLRR